MADEDKSSKKHQATDKRKRDAKKKGNVIKSQDVGIAVGLLAGFGAIAMLHSFYLKNFHEVFAFCAMQLKNTDQINLKQTGFFIFEHVALLSLPIMLAVMLGGLISQFGMVGFVFTGEQIKPKMEKINPMKGFKRWISIRSMMELGKSLIKIIATFAVGITVLWGAVSEVRNSVLLDAQGIMSLGGTLLQGLFIKILILLVVIAIADYMFQRWQWQRDLKMSDKDIKDEFKEQEGDPYMKGKRRQMAQQVAHQQASAENTPQADAIVINPTELAIALKYDPKLSPVPYVISKGRRRDADEIRRVARKNGIPVIRNKPLAWDLFEQCEIGDIVPSDLYKPVAEILAYVFSLRDTGDSTLTAAAASAHTAAARDYAHTPRTTPTGGPTA